MLHCVRFIIKNIHTVLVEDWLDDRFVFLDRPRQNQDILVTVAVLGDQFFDFIGDMKNFRLFRFATPNADIFFLSCSQLKRTLDFVGGRIGGCDPIILQGQQSILVAVRILRNPVVLHDLYAQTARQMIERVISRSGRVEQLMHRRRFTYIGFVQRQRDRYLFRGAQQRRNDLQFAGRETVETVNEDISVLHVQRLDDAGQRLKDDLLLEVFVQQRFIEGMVKLLQFRQFQLEIGLIAGFGLARQYPLQVLLFDASAAQFQKQIRQLLDETFFVGFPAEKYQFLFLLYQNLPYQHAESGFRQLLLLENRRLLQQIPRQPAETERLQIHRAHHVLSAESLELPKLFQYRHLRLELRVLRNQHKYLRIRLFRHDHRNPLIYRLFLIR